MSTKDGIMASVGKGDPLTPEQRHKNMSRIRSKNTKPEEVVRRYLFSKGFRYRKNDKRYPGKPDIVLPKYRTVIFVQGCFWHQHPGCRNARIPITNRDYWEPELEKNVQRDQTEQETLRHMGWHVVIVWECDISSASKREERLCTLLKEIINYQ